MATIWSSNPGNPPKSVADRLGMDRWQFGERLHAIKQAAGLGGADRVSIDDDGNVRDDQNETIGNLNDEN